MVDLLEVVVGEAVDDVFLGLEVVTPSRSAISRSEVFS
jgi:hypothetical protein